MITKSADWWKKEMSRAIAGDRSQEIDDRNSVRTEIFKSLLDDAANDPNFNEFSAAVTVKNLYGPSERDQEEAMKKLRAVRRHLFAG